MPWFFEYVILPIGILVMAIKLYLAWRGWRDGPRPDNLNHRDYGGGW